MVVADHSASFAMPPREQGGEQLAFRGERACRNAASPALGGEAAPIASPRSASYTEVAGFGAAMQPSGGASPLATGGANSWLSVASGLAPRWVAKPPQSLHHGLPDTPRWLVLGLRCSPAGDKPPRHRGGEQLAFCGERACPALGGEAAPIASPRSARYTEVAGFGAAMQPSGDKPPRHIPKKQ